MSAILLLLLAGAAWYAYTAMTDKLVEVLTDGAAQGSDLAGSVEGAAVTAPAAVNPDEGSTRDEQSKQDEGSKQGDEPKEDASASPAGQAESPDTQGSSGKKPGKTSNDNDVKSSSADRQQASVSPEAAASAAKRVSVKDRIEIGKVVLDHWNAAELKAMSAMLSGGLTIAEKRELKKEAMSKLTPEEYNELIAIAEKLGLSEGKSYTDSSKEK